MYAMLTLQPALAIASSMLRGTRTTLFWLPLPSELPTNPWVARQIDRVHGINAVVLLGVIAWQIGGALRKRNAREAV
jgi:cytochrome b561